MSQTQTTPQQPSQQPSLYRRNRPRTFAEVVGQETVVRTLRNAVERSKVHHAYLFVGSRGTGKTSMAKILAACLNCERGPTVDPCGECESCRAIAQARSLDVIEMDAASNNSVEDIRELRESVAFAPVSGRSKVYILDEAHMLSQAAWNAFLKTLEEPPPNTIFVLATTEAQKVPATVVDRCHRFDFGRPSVEQIAMVLRRAAAAESIEIPPEAVAALARAATGSFRDALGTLEQLLTYSGPQIALQDVLDVLGATDAALLEATIDAVHAGDARGALLAVARCSESGRDASTFAADLERRARELLVVGALGEIPAELALTAEADAQLQAQAQRVTQDTVVRLLEQLGATLEAVKAGAEPRTQLELALVKAARGLINRPPADDPGLARSASPVGPDADLATTSPERKDPAKAPPERADRLEAQPGGGLEDSEPATTSPAPIVEAQSPAAGEPAAGDLDSLWRATVDLVGAENKLLSAVLREARPLGINKDELTVAFASTASFLKKKAEDGAHRGTVTEALRGLTGQRLRLTYELHEDLPPAQAGIAQTPRTEEEWVARFKEELGAEELVGVAEGAD